MGDDCDARLNSVQLINLCSKFQCNEIFKPRLAGSSANSKPRNVIVGTKT